MCDKRWEVKYSDCDLGLSGCAMRDGRWSTQTVICFFWVCNKRWEVKHSDCDLSLSGCAIRSGGLKHSDWFGSSGCAIRDGRWSAQTVIWVYLGVQYEMGSEVPRLWFGFIWVCNTRWEVKCPDCDLCFSGCAIRDGRWNVQSVISLSVSFTGDGDDTGRRQERTSK